MTPSDARCPCRPECPDLEHLRHELEVRCQEVRELENLLSLTSEHADAVESDLWHRNQEVMALNEHLTHTNHALTALAAEDGLTGLFNRRSFDQRLNAEWRRLSRTEQCLSVLLCDIDYFKRYNDTYGHQAGDAALVTVAEVLRDTVKRPGDMTARYGGEEFVVLLPDTNVAGAWHVAEALLVGLAQRNLPHAASAVTARVTLSIGIASGIPVPEDLPARLVNQADTALYEAKSAGRNRAVLYDPAMGPVRQPKNAAAVTP